MPRKKRQESPTGIYHWIVRGINKKKLFHSSEDFSQWRSLVLEYKALHNICIYHYCFMTNHVHMLIRAEHVYDVSKFSHFVQRCYAYYYCKSYKWAGSVFQRGYKNLPIDREEYLLECGRYIERNPLRAGMIDDVARYPHSSYPFYASDRPDDLLTISPAYLGLAGNAKDRQEIYAKYVRENRIQEEMIKKGLLTV